MDYKQFIKIICRDLKIPNHKYKFVKIKDTRIAYLKNDVIYINKNTRNKLDIYFSIAHELRHVYQLKNGYDFSNYRTSNELSIEDYNLQEVELEANAYATLIMISLFNVQPKFEGLSENVKKEIYKKAKKLVEL